MDIAVPLTGGLKAFLILSSIALLVAWLPVLITKSFSFVLLGGFALYFNQKLCLRE